MTPSVADLFPLCQTTQPKLSVLDRQSFASRAREGTIEMDDNAQPLRSHIQVIVSLINLHAQYIDSVDVKDFVAKLRMRIELIAATLPMALGPPPDKQAIVEALESIRDVVSRILDPQEIHSCELTLGDVTIAPSALGPMCQLFAEFLSNIYARAAPGEPTRVVAQLLAVPSGQIALTLRSEGGASDAKAKALDLLSSRIVQELARSLGGEARFDATDIHDASLIFPTSAGAAD
jgi:two-component sensor histidine kinase